MISIGYFSFIRYFFVYFFKVLDKRNISNKTQKPFQEVILKGLLLFRNNYHSAKTSYRYSPCYHATTTTAATTNHRCDRRMVYGMFWFHDFLTILNLSKLIQICCQVLK